MEDGNPPREASEEPPGPPIRVLVVDDVAEICGLFRSAAPRTGLPLDLITETNALAAIERVRHAEFKLVISDYRMPQADGLQVLASAKERHPDGYRVLMTGYNDVPASADEFRSGGVDAFFRKPIPVRQIIHLLKAFATDDVARLRQWREEARRTEETGVVPHRD